MELLCHAYQYVEEAVPWQSFELRNLSLNREIQNRSICSAVLWTCGIYLLLNTSVVHRF